MHKYTWNIDQIKFLHNEILGLMKSAKTKEEYADLKEKLFSYQVIIHDYNHGFKYMNSGDEILLPGAVRKEVTDYELKRTKLKIPDLLNLTSEFYCSLDYEFYEKINPIIVPKNCLLHISTSKNYGGACYYDLHRYQPFIHIRDTKSILTAKSFCHEFAHGLEFSYNYDDYRYSSNEVTTLEETVSIFLEFLFIDFLKAKGVSEHDIALLEIVHYEDLFENCMVLEDILGLAKISKNQGRKLIKDIYEEICIENNSVAVMSYFISRMVALQLYEQYQNNPSYAINNLKKLMMTPKTDNFYAILDEIEVNLQDSSRYLKSYDEKMKRFL